MADAREAVLTALGVSRETAARLDAYVALLEKWQRAKNLVAQATLGEVWQRHILDSGQIARFAAAGEHWADLGSGAGFPGGIVAILNADLPGFSIRLVEANARKCAFLREAIRITGARATVYNGRIENFAAESAGSIDVVTARALADLSGLLELAHPVLKTEGRAVFLKGQHLDRELTEASRYWKFDSTTHQSLSDPAGRVLVLSGVRRIGDSETATDAKS